MSRATTFLLSASTAMAAFMQVADASAQQAAASAAAAAAPAEAQAADDPSAGDVVVTARRSSERAQDVPLAVFSQSADQLAAKGIDDLESLARFTPSLQFKDFVTTFNGNATIRGLSQINTANPVGNVGVFLNGIYLQRGYMVDLSLGDFARIETVNGPQSALYGQNTFAGAINYVTNAPTQEFHGDGSATIGTAGRKDVSLALGGPLIKDILAFRIFGGIQHSDGTWKNELPGITGSLNHFGGYRRYAGSGALKFKPTDRLTIDASYQENHREEYIRPYYGLLGTYVGDKLNCGPVVAATGRPGLFCGTFPVDPSSLRSSVSNAPAAPFSVDQPPTVSTTSVARIGLDYRFSDAVSFHYLFGSTRGKAEEDLSIATNTYNPTGQTVFSQQHEGGTLRYTSHEARLAYAPPAGSLQLEAGYFRSRADDRYLFGVRSNPVNTPVVHQYSDPLVVPTGLIVFTNSDAYYAIDSVFGRASLGLLDNRLRFTGELRWSDTRLSYNDLNARAANPALPILTREDKDWSPRITVEYHITPNNLAYANAARGVKAGGFNGYRSSTYTLTTAEQSFGQETNWTYEAGLKNTFLGGRLTVNADVFYVDWNNKQSAIVPSAFAALGVPATYGTVAPTITATQGGVTSLGVEVAGSYRPVRALTLTFSLSAINPKYKDGSLAANFIGLCDGVLCPANGSLNGKQVERTSKYSGALGVQYDRPISANLTAFIGADVSYQSKQFGDPMNLSAIRAFALGDARIGIESGMWKAWVSSENILDHKYIQNVFYIPSTRQFTASFGERRTVLATISAKF